GRDHGINAGRVDDCRESVLKRFGRTVWPWRHLVRIIGRWNWSKRAFDIKRRTLGNILHDEARMADVDRTATKLRRYRARAQSRDDGGEVAGDPSAKFPVRIDRKRKRRARGNDRPCRREGGRRDEITVLDRHAKPSASAKIECRYDAGHIVGLGSENARTD